MARKSLFVATEALEVEKLQQARADAERDSEFDVLYQDITEDQAAKDAAQSDDENDTPLDGEEDTSTESPEASEVENVDTDDATVAAESFLRHHQANRDHTVAQESQFTESNFSPVTRYVGNKTLSGLNYLKDVGFEYGPVLLKHVYKGVLYALNKTVRAVVQGSVSMTNYVDKKIHSYDNMKTDLDKIKETLDLLETQKVDIAFTKDVVINQLKIGANYNFKESVKVAHKFFEDFFNGFEKNVQGNIAVTRNIVSAVVHGQAIQPAQLTYERFNFPNFVRRNVDGYVPDSDYVNSYAYQFVLPGDLVFVGWLPKQHLTEHDTIIEALNHSKMMVGVNTQASVVKDGVKYLSLSELKEMVRILESICDYGIALDKTYQAVIKNRNSIRGVMNVYMRFLLAAKRKVSIRDSLADFIAVKIACMDRTHIAGSMYVNDYMVRVVTASLSYLKEAIKAYS
jgi:hypothetical protein